VVQIDPKMPFTKPPKSHLMTYPIGRGEQGILIYEPYKSHLVPIWSFRTVAIARTSSEALWEKYLEFYEDEDFVGMDFTQMGMMRSKRYANYKGGRKYMLMGRRMTMQLREVRGTREGKKERRVGFTRGSGGGVKCMKDMRG
jgi:hypothetical protein